MAPNPQKAPLQKVRPAGLDRTSILPLFPLLSSHDPPTRLDASLSLLTSLPLATSASPTPVDDADTPYAIKRLVNGLASSNEASRQGFAVALTELLARLPTEKAQAVLPLILTASTPNAGSDSREERDLLFARLLGLHAVIRSGVLFSPEATNGESFKEVILALLALSGKKSWIREPAFWALIEAVRTLLEREGEAVPEWREEVCKWVIQRLLNDSREKARGLGSEKVALVLVLQAYGVVSPVWFGMTQEEMELMRVCTFNRRPTTLPSSRLLSPLATFSLARLLLPSRKPSRRVLPAPRSYACANLPNLQGSSGEAEASAPSANGPKMGSNAVKTAKGGAPAPGAAPHFVWSEIFDLYFPEDGRAPRRGEAALAEGRAKWSEVWRVLVDRTHPSLFLAKLA